LNCVIGCQEFEKVLNFAKIYKVLKKDGNSEFNHLFIKILFFTADGSYADVFALCSMNKIFEK